MNSILLCIIQGKDAYFSILKDSSSIVYFSHLKYNTHLNIIDYPNKFFERLIELTTKFQTNIVRIGFVNDDYSVIPYDFADNINLEDLIIASLPADKRIMHTEDAGYGICKSFVPKDFADYFYGLEGDLVLTNCIASTGRIYAMSEDGLHIHMLPHKIFIALVKNGRVEFNNHFHITGDLAAIYFILLVLNQLEIEDNIPLVMHQVAEGNNVVKELRNQTDHKINFPNSKYSLNQDSSDALSLLFLYESL